MTQASIDISNMLAEEALFCGAHFAHIAARNEHERLKRINLDSARALASFERSSYVLRRWR